jgi:hypothetical protein
MSSPQLASTIFIGGADESLAVKDVYKASSGVVINDYTSGAATAQLIDSAQAAQTTEINVGDVAYKGDKFAETPAAQKKIDKESFMKNLAALNMKVVNGMKSLSSTIQSNLAKANDLRNKIDVTIAGVTTTVTAADLTTVSGLTGILINTVNGSDLPINFKDVATVVQMSKNLIGEASKCGLTGFLTAFSGNSEYRKYALTSLTLSAARSALANSDHFLLSEIVHIGGAKHLKAAYPGFVAKYSRGYRIAPRRNDRGVKLAHNPAEEFRNTITNYLGLDSGFGVGHRNQRIVMRPQAGPDVSPDLQRGMRCYVSANAPSVRGQIAAAKLNGALGSLNTAAQTPDYAFHLLTHRVKTLSCKQQIQANHPKLILPGQLKL